MFVAWHDIYCHLGLDARFFLVLESGCLVVWLINLGVTGCVMWACEVVKTCLTVLGRLGSTQGVMQDWYRWAFHLVSWYNTKCRADLGSLFNSFVTLGGGIFRRLVVSCDLVIYFHQYCSWVVCTFIMEIWRLYFDDDTMTVESDVESNSQHGNSTERGGD